MLVLQRQVTERLTCVSVTAADCNRLLQLVCNASAVLLHVTAVVYFIYRSISIAMMMIRDDVGGGDDNDNNMMRLFLPNLNASREHSCLMNGA